MDLTQKIVVFGIIANTVIAAVTVLVSFLGYRQSKSIHLIVNSRLSGWLATEREQGTTAGREAERKDAATKAERKATIPIKLMMLTAALALLTGCSTTNITRLVGALAKDPATVAVSVQSVYGTVYILRTGNTNQQIILGPISVK
jgi:hypothetical protein